MKPWTHDLLNCRNNKILVYYSWNHFVYLTVYFLFSSHFFQSGTIIFFLLKLLLLLYSRKIRKKEFDDMVKIYSIFNFFYNTWMFYLLFLYFKCTLQFSLSRFFTKIPARDGTLLTRSFYYSTIFWRKHISFMIT